LPPKVFEVLTALIKQHGQLVNYQELMDEVWHDTFVEESNLRYSIHTLRKTFDEDFIEIVPI
jgi:DNA-binding winged helix-turn-helix (wHTH) protein